MKYNYSEDRPDIERDFLDGENEDTYEEDDEFRPVIGGYCGGGYVRPYGE